MDLEQDDGRKSATDGRRGRDGPHSNESYRFLCGMARTSSPALPTHTLRGTPPSHFRQDVAACFWQTLRSIPPGSRHADCASHGPASLPREGVGAPRWPPPTAWTHPPPSDNARGAHASRGVRPPAVRRTTSLPPRLSASAGRGRAWPNPPLALPAAPCARTAATTGLPAFGATGSRHAPAAAADAAAAAAAANNSPATAAAAAAAAAAEACAAGGVRRGIRTAAGAAPPLLPGG